MLFFLWVLLLALQTSLSSLSFFQGTFIWYFPPPFNEVNFFAKVLEYLIRIFLFLACMFNLSMVILRIDCVDLHYVIIYSLMILYYLPISMAHLLSIYDIIILFYFLLVTQWFCYLMGTVTEICIRTFRCVGLALASWSWIVKQYKDSTIDFIIWMSNPTNSLKTV